MPWVSPDEDIENKNASNEADMRELQKQHVDTLASDSRSSQTDHNLVSWLGNLETSFNSLNCEEKNKTLDFLIDICEGPQLYHLSKRLNIILKRDFLKLLPHDIVCHLLQYLNADTLKICCQVSKRWNYIINNCNRAWKAAALSQGVNFEGRTVRKTSDFKKLYLVASSYIRRLGTGAALKTSVMYGHRDRIMTVYYKDDIIATGSDDHTVRLWSCVTGTCFRILHTANTVAAVKFDNSRIVTASFNTTATLWSFETGEKLRTYAGHVAAVFCIDFDAKMDLLTTGSADSTVKIWILSSGVMIKSLAHHRSAWKTHVCLYWNPEQQYYSILSRDSTVIHAWRLSRSHEVISSTELDDPGENLLPGWQVKGSYVTYAALADDGNCVINQVDLSVEEILPEQIFKFRPAYEPQTFLGSGSRFILFLQAEHGERSVITVLQQHNGQVVANIPMPPDYRPSKRSSTFTLGNREWLDGFTDNADQGVFLITSLRDNGIVQFRWLAELFPRKSSEIYLK